MINGKRVLAYIGARSGSKSIKDKNIADVCGKPLIAYSIEAAKGSKYVDKIIVSTDSEQYAEIARRYGAETPFIRPAHLATDTALEKDVAMHLINWIEQNTDEKFDLIVKLEITSPLRLPEDIDKAIEKIEKENADTIATVTEAFTPPFWMNTLPPNHSMNGFISPDVATKNRQELPTYYQLDGVVFVAKWNFFKQKQKWYSEDNGFATITPQERAIDIDTPIQLELVRLLIKKRIEQHGR